MKNLLFFLVFCAIACESEKSTSTIDNRLLELVSKDLSYDKSRELMILLKSQPKIKRITEEQYYFEEFYNKHQVIQSKLESKGKITEEFKGEILEFYNQALSIIETSHGSFLIETIDLIDLPSELEKLEGSKSYEILSLKLSMILNYTSGYIYSSINYYGGSYDCSNPGVYATDTINKNDPITLFFGKVFVGKDGKIIIEKVNNESISKTIILDSNIGISTVLIEELDTGINTISGYLTAPTPNGIAFKSPFKSNIYVK